MPEVRRRGGGTRKYGKNKVKCERYRREHRGEKNKMVRLKAMIKNLRPENNMRKQAEARIEKLQQEIWSS